MHPIVKTLLKTFVLSTVLSICVNGAFYAYNMEGVRYNHLDAAINIATVTLVLTSVLLVLSLPALFLMRHSVWKHPFVGFLLYYSGPVLLVLIFFVKTMDQTTQFFGQLTGLIYLGFSTIFYYMVTKGYRERFGYPAGSLSASDRMSVRINPTK